MLSLLLNVRSLDNVQQPKTYLIVDINITDAQTIFLNQPLAGLQIQIRINLIKDVQNQNLFTVNRRNISETETVCNSQIITKIQDREGFCKMLFSCIMMPISQNICAHKSFCGEVFGLMKFCLYKVSPPSMPSRYCPDNNQITTFCGINNGNVNKKFLRCFNKNLVVS